ncbi:MAG: hydantoinase/oxoprolinase family protein [Actinomycetota bacterium]
MTRARTLRVGIDTGGTFTDVVAFDEVEGRLYSTKTPSTPHDPAEGFMAGIELILGIAGAEGGDISAVAHGTTVATNALLQEDFSGLGFVTTAGFRCVLEIARQSVPAGYGNSYFWVKPDRIVPIDLVKEVPERCDSSGRVVRPFDEAAAAEVARWFKDRGIASVGVCFVNSYVNPEHEQRMRATLEREFPECSVSISSDVLREYREYERSMTTLVDAFVKPKVGTYVEGIQKRLNGIARNGGAAAPFYVMKSNGGVTSAAEVGKQPITTVTSGPAAGVLGALVVAAAARFEQVLTLDAGGTSTDVSVVRAGKPAITTEGSVGRYPVKVPMVDVVTVGTGGGSIAWRAPDGNLKVGPRSAGADPGPMCYGKGGREPTTTDAHLMLGRIPPALLGGQIPLDAGLAREGLAALADELGLGMEESADGVLEIAAWNQANAIRQVTVRRGLDVRDFAMIAFGGSGPLMACRLLDILDLRAAVVPQNPGNLSAFGLLTVDVRNDFVRTFVRRIADLDTAALEGVYEELLTEAAAALEREGFEAGEHVFSRSADLRYLGQAFEVRVAAPDGNVDESSVVALAARFHDEHERLYGYCYREDQAHVVELVNVRVTGIGPITRPELPEVVAADGDTRRARHGHRRVLFEDRWHYAGIYRRDDLMAGDGVEGPAVIEEFGSTTPIAPGFVASVDRFGSLVITRGGV